ncbi:hypothetical protein [Actinoplanes sp. NPDC026670]|uniref:hypothetical protein n=1 Tax=Actinoplanes sp. NPDC026670 TaxID=3154700 RepID=UPI0033EFE35F
MISKILFASAGAMAVALSGGTAAAAAGPVVPARVADDPEVVKVCIVAKTGAMRYMLANTTTCRRNEVLREWNVYGLRGETGPAGPAGAAGQTGPAGPAGPAGPTGAAGPVGAQGAMGLTGAAGAAGNTTLSTASGVATMGSASLSLACPNLSDTAIYGYWDAGTGETRTLTANGQDPTDPRVWLFGWNGALTATGGSIYVICRVAP